jgi:hypothetical protein
VSFQKTAALDITATEIIGEKMPAFFTGRGDHGKDYIEEVLGS